MNLRDFYQTSMEPNPFVASELDLDCTHISIYTYISSDQLKSYSGNRERKKETDRQTERGRREGESWGYVAWKCEDHKKLIMCSFMDYYFSLSSTQLNKTKKKITSLHPHLSFIT